MQKKGELSRLAINLLIGSLIVILAIIIWIIIKGILNEQNNQQELFNDSSLNLKISEVKKIDDSTLNVTVNRNSGEGDFVALSFAVEDGITTEIIRKNLSMEEFQNESISLNFLAMNTSKIKKVSITPIFVDKDGKEIIGNVKDEYIAPNTCSNFCPTGSQCGYNDCGMKCGNGCSAGYLCLNYKCIKQQTSSGSGGSSGGGSGGSTTPTCTDTCSSLGYTCGIQTVCGSNVNCGSCSTGYVCGAGLCVREENCIDTCSSLGYTCGNREICGVNLNCGNCSSGYTCAANSTCIKDCVPTTCLALGRTCGTISNGCSGTLNCGACLSGYSCAVNGTCIKDVVIDCGTVSCKSGEYCFNGVCLLNVTGKTYFIATNGNDNNPGTFSQPFYSWQKGVQVAQPGDIVYIRGGVWTPTQHILRGSYDTGGIAMAIEGETPNFGVSGTANAPIRYYNYPGETPIMDGSLLSPNQDRWQSGISISNAEYIYLKGLTVRNIFQSPPDFTHPKPYSEVFGIGSFEAANLRFENIAVYNVNGRGFQHWSGSWSELEGPGSLFDSDNTSWINCDSYNLYDRYSSAPGNAADGWKVVGSPSNYFYWEGCRAWNYSDDGFDPNGAHRFFKNCWVMSTDFYEGLSDDWDPEGNGFKTTGISPIYAQGYTLGGENFVKYENCIAAFCSGIGFYNNILNNYDNEWPNNALVYNSLGYKNQGNFWDASTNDQSRNHTTIFRNNIAYKSTYDGQGMYPLYEVGIYNPNIYPHSNNTWRAKVGEPWPGWEYNPAYTVTDADFVSLDASQLTRPRKADGSLPDITFGHLVQGSDLIDGGMVIPGYHCSTSGAHPGENCREWFGNAPDLGPFESNY